MSNCLFGHSFTDECSGRDGGYEEYTMEGFYDTCLGSDNMLSWDPIVNPDLFGKSVGGPHSLGTSLPNAWHQNNEIKVAPRKTCAVQVSHCFPNTDRLFEVKGIKHEYDSTGALVRTKTFTEVTKNLVLAVGSVVGFFASRKHPHWWQLCRRQAFAALARFALLLSGGVWAAAINNLRTEVRNPSTP